MRMWTLLCVAAALLGAGCSATLSSYADPTAVTLQSPVDQAMALDVPVRFFDDELPARWQHKGLGVINDQATFQKFWAAYAANVTSLPPAIDFENYALVFVYDPEYYNLVKIVGLNVWQGVANPIVERTNWKLAIGGDPMMRKINKLNGKPVPEPIVNVALLQVPRNKPDRPGVTALLVEGDKDDEGDSRVIPIPERP